MANLTKKQQELLFYLKKYIGEKGISPTLKEIANKFSISKVSAQQRVANLVLKGYIQKGQNKPRSITIKNDPDIKSVSLPILGFISAGDGIVVFEESNPELIEVPSSMVKTTSSYYCLQVKGNSMVGDGILDNDFVIIRQQTYADNGDIVVAVTNDALNERANLKRFYNLGDRIKLKPSNPDMSPKIYSKDQVLIRGKFCGLIRKEF